MTTTVFSADSVLHYFVWTNATGPASPPTRFSWKCTKSVVRLRIPNGGKCHRVYHRGDHHVKKQRPYHTSLRQPPDDTKAFDYEPSFVHFRITVAWHPRDRIDVSPPPLVRRWEHRLQHVYIDGHVRSSYTSSPHLHGEYSCASGILNSTNDEQHVCCWSRRAQSIMLLSRENPSDPAVVTEPCKTEPFHKWFLSRAAT